MHESLNINSADTDIEKYKTILSQLDHLINNEEPLISNLANFTAVLKEAFEKISWVGFYFATNKKLFLGPFQGKVACTVIEFGKGVCGTSAERKETIIAEDVEKFPGHIFCDGGSKSEIVVPLLKDDKAIGVLDLDSYKLSSFNETDKFYLELLCKTLTQKLSFEKEVL